MVELAVIYHNPPHKIGSSKTAAALATIVKEMNPGAPGIHQIKGENRHQKTTR